jgi:hypothetical protein
MIAVWMTAVLITAARPVSGALQVAFIAPREMTDSLVRRICAEADDIWQPAGVALECHRIRSVQEASGWPLIVNLDEQQARRRPEGALGWILFTTDSPGRSIYLSQAHAEELIRHSPGWRNITVAWHETLIGRALGRALAHEVGHYLLRSKLHTPRGLMRAVLSGDEFLALSRDGFELTPDQSLAAARLRMEYQPATAAWR